MSEGYPKHWIHATVHINPETGEVNQDGDIAVRLFIENAIKERDEALALVDELKMYFKAIVEARRTDKTLCSTLDRPTEFAIAESAKREIGKQVRQATEALEKIAQFKGGKG